jgi:putative phosphoribosyl transferase
MRFRDRIDAGRLLAARLAHLEHGDPVVLALPRGGVPVGHEIARALRAPLEVIMVRKLGVPAQPELALGAVVDGESPEVVVNPDIAHELGLGEAELWAAAKAQLAEIERRRQLYRGDHERVRIEGRTAVVADDGVATGASMRAALRAIRRWRPARLVLAVPVAAPEDFWAVGTYYDDFAQVSDEKVVELLNRTAEPAAAEAENGSAQGRS